MKFVIDATEKIRDVIDADDESWAKVLFKQKYPRTSIQITSVQTLDAFNGKFASSHGFVSLASGNMILMPTKLAQNLEVVKTPEKFTERELERAVRDAIIAEQGAIKQYETVADATDNDAAKKVLQSIAEEEKVHIGELQKLLESLSPKEEEKIDEGKAEAEDTTEDASE
jgi:hypothetical protein